LTFYQAYASIFVRNEIKMSEKAPNVPTTEQVGQWLEHSQKLIKEGAVIDHMGKLSITGTQYDELSAQAPSHPLSEVAHSETQQGAHEQVEAMSAERLKEIMQDSMYAARPYIQGAREVTYSVFGSADPRESRYIPQLLNVASNNWGGQVKPDVSEQVTVMPYTHYSMQSGLDRKLYSLENQKILWPSREGGPREAVYIINYNTLAGASKDGAKYVYDDHVGRPNSYSYAIALPESAAKELEAAMKADPNLARQLGDELIYNDEAYEATNPYGNSKHGWDKYRPPYDSWREANGGVDRMAFFDQFEQAPETAEVVEY
jgi:hypothetical protein